ncbi:MAG: hypothetical protein HGB02_05475 [Chlorobiaceae bacterium]|nr:hypothetical protein [Chlorobiaceae bacterium]
MNLSHIIIDDANPLHRELPIYRSGEVNAVRLSDSGYQAYASLEVSAHDLAALFHYGVVESLNALRFVSESGKGLDSWDEAFLSSGQIPALLGIIGECLTGMEGKAPERVLLGWHDVPEETGLTPDGAPHGIAYWREIDPGKAAAFLGRLRDFAEDAARAGYDLEFIL